MAKTTHPSIIKKHDGYTTYKNGDAEMVKKIKEFKPTSENFTWCQHSKSNIVNEINAKDLLCIDDDGNHFVIEKEDLDASIAGGLLQSINEKFSVADAIKSTFGTLYSSDGYRTLVVKDKSSAAYDNIDKCMSSEVGVKISTYRGFELSEDSEGEWGSLMFCHLDINGNITNRDYNVDLTQWLDNKPKTRLDIVKELIKVIPDVEYKYYGNKWYYGDNVIEYDPNATANNRSDGRMVLQLSIEPNRKKMPKTAITVDREHLLLKVLPLINTLTFGTEVDLSKYIDVAKLDAKEISVKRIQKTKINEAFFSEVYDLTEEIEEIGNSIELLTALQKIENSIDVGVNVNIVEEIVTEYLKEGDLPSFSFDKGEVQEDHSDYVALVKLPYGCNFEFNVAEGEACEISWSGSIYYTDIVNFELIN